MAANQIDKLIVTNKSALQKKYGKNFSAIEKSLFAFVKADAARGIISKLVWLDDENIRKYRAPVVVHATNQRENKNTIDALFNWFSPDYLLIIGSRDVVPHIKLRNLTHDEDGLLIDSDLPYASNENFSNIGSPHRFLSPARAVGRLPDITGGKDHKYLLTVLKNAATVKPLPAKEYENYFALSAKVWTGSSAISVSKMFNDVSKMKLAPNTKGPYKKELNARVHFFNCHGGMERELFFGQKIPDGAMTTAYSSEFIDRRLKPGTFVAAECCYGAELYDQVNGQLMSISNTYLYKNAAAYVGSTTVAYGPEEGQGSADLITQYFVQNVLKGYSTGRAFLEARQKFIATAGQSLDAVELKTISQFLLLGDPSLHLVKTMKKTMILENGKLVMSDDSKIKSQRKARRARLKENGAQIGKNAIELKKIPFRKSALHRQFSKILREIKFGANVSNAFGASRRTDEQHFSYVESRDHSREVHHPRIVIFKKTKDEVVVKMYHRK